jgi:hypothetical protein
VILGFKLGIECFQLLIVLASIPLLVQLAPGGYGGAARRVLAALSAMAALGWLAERAFNTPNPLSAALGSVTMSTTLLVVGAMLVAGAALFGFVAWRRPSSCVQGPLPQDCRIPGQAS